MTQGCRLGGFPIRVSTRSMPSGSATPDTKSCPARPSRSRYVRSRRADAVRVFPGTSRNTMPTALFREYRRDVGRYLAGTWSSIPRCRAATSTTYRASVLHAFRARAQQAALARAARRFPGRDAARQFATYPWRDVRCASTELARDGFVRERRAARRDRRSSDEPSLGRPGDVATHRTDATGRGALPSARRAHRVGRLS